MKKLTIYYDYEGIGKWATGEWKAKNKITQGYRDYIKQVKDKLELHFVHVKGHSGRFTKNDGGGIKVDNSTKHIPFAVIVAATNGDEAAIQEILDFYDSYISKLSLRKLYDEYGNVYMVVDSELKGRIQAAVMDMIANFEIIVMYRRSGKRRQL